MGDGRRLRGGRQFSSDYPHWDFDSPLKALPAAMPREMRTKIMGENAARLYDRRLGRG